MSTATAGVNLDIVQAMDHRGLFGPWFKGGSSWDGWRAVLRAAYGLPMSEQEREFFRTVAEREPPSKRVKELWVIAGRRAGKDSIASLITAHAATFFDHRERLRPGERALCACLACDRDQARIVLNYVRSYFRDIPPLAAMITREVAHGFELRNHVDVAISTNSFRNVRGRPILCAVLDECAFYRSEDSSSSDEELYRALVPGTVTLADDALIVAISTAYAKRGLLFKKFKEHYGKGSDDVLVIRAPSLALNPTLDQGIIAAALEEDHEAASAEWLAEWRQDISSYIDRAAVEACVAAGRYELPPRNDTAYTAFVDPSGGSADSMTLAVACRDAEGRGVLCCLREARPPFSPEAVVAEFARTLKQYRVDRVTGDRWGGEFVREPFRQYGIDYQIADRPKSDFFRDFLPLINSGRVELLDNSKMISQLCGLERRVGRGTGRDSIDHGPGAHDDLINSAAAVLVLVAGEGSTLWKRDALASVPLPRAHLVFCVAITDKNNCAGLAYFGASRVPGSGICLLDCEQGPLSPALLHGVLTRLTELAEECGAGQRVLFTSSELGAQFERMMGFRPEIIDLILRDKQLLPISAASHVQENRVRVCDQIFSKGGVPLAFLNGATMDDSPLALAFVAGVCLLDANRRVGAAA
jgi:hypothetical protein